MRKERYTIGKSALKHEGRQKLSVLSPQITLMWNNLAFCRWCFSSSCLLCLLPYHLCLSSVELPITLEIFSKRIYKKKILFIFFSLLVQVGFLLLHALKSGSPALLFVSCLCSLAVFWIPKCWDYRAEGEWLLTSLSDLFTITRILTLLRGLWPNSAQIHSAHCHLFFFPTQGQICIYWLPDTCNISRYTFNFVHIY